MGGFITIRASQLASTGCERHDAAKLFKFQIEKQGFKLRKTKFGVAGKLGTSMHRSVELALKEKYDTGAVLPVEFYAKNATEVFTEEIEKDGDEVEYDRATESLDMGTKQLIYMSHATKKVVDAIEPLQVELQLEADLQGIQVTGKPDVLTRDMFVRDFKTGKNRTPGPHNYQIGTYSLLAKANGMEIRGAAVDYVKKPSKTELKMYDKAMEEVGHYETPDAVTEVYDLVEAEKAAYSTILDMSDKYARFMDPTDRLYQDPYAFRANPSSALCSPKYCSAHGTDFCALGRPVTTGEE